MESIRKLTGTGGITETGQKWIALITMILDHICYSFVPMWRTTGDSSWPVLIMGLAFYMFYRRWSVQVAASSVYYILYGVVYMICMTSAMMPDFAWWQIYTQHYELYGILAAPSH